MKKLINNYLYKIWFVKHFLSALWMHVNGRWFVFRDAPLVVVEYVASKEPKGKHQDTDNFILSAKDEMKLRQRRVDLKTEKEKV